VTSIDFYFNAKDRLQVACRLAGKALAQAKRMLIYAPEPEVASRIDRLLWTWPAIGFVPHCALHHPLAPDTPLLIAADAETPPGCELLLNLGRDCPPHFERFERLLEVVGADEAEREAGRSRYRFYRERGYKIANHDLAKEAERSE
jgi:DNA polymerase-3 subunit chi